MKKYNIPDRVLKDLTKYASQSDVDKIVLFGSRAKGTFSSRSDIDIAVSGGDFDSFYWNVTDQTHSLLSFDIVDMKTASEELLEEIKKDGVTIYEKA